MPVATEAAQAVATIDMSSGWTTAAQPRRPSVLSSSPTIVQEDLGIDLPRDRDQLETRSLPRFVELRHHVYEQIQRAKRGFNADAA